MAATVVGSATDPLQQRRDAAQSVGSASDGGRAAAADGAVAATVVGSATDLLQQSRDAATCAGSATSGGRAAAAYGAVAATVVGSATDGWRAAAADGAAEATVVGPATNGGRAKPLQRAPPTQLVWQRRGLHVRQLREELVRAAAAVEAALAVMEAEI